MLLPSRSKVLAVGLATAVSALLSQTAHGDNGVWAVDASGNWSTPGNWVSNTVADGSGFTASFTNDITDIRTITLDSNRTISNVLFSDNGSAGSSWILNSNILTLAGATPTITTTTDATIGTTLAGTAGLTKSGTASLTLTGTSSFTGAFNVNSGTLNYSGSSGNSGNNTTTVGNVAGARAVMNIATSGTVALGNAQALTLGGLGSGAINQSSGIFNFSGATALYLSVGSNGGYGSFTLSGGTLNTINASGIRVGGGGGFGSYVQTGGTLNMQRFFAICAPTIAGGAGVATFTGGTATSDVTRGFIVGNNSSGAGYMNIGTMAGGNALIHSQASQGFQLADSNNVTGTGTLNLNSGTLKLTSAGILKSGASATSTAILNLNGGTILANSNNLTLISAASTPFIVNMYNGGLVVDTQTFTSSISANLLKPSGNGVYVTGGSLAIPSGGGAGYIGAPLVSITGGGGSGATAVANLTNGVVTGVTMTSPGQNYVAGQTLTFAFTGGGSTAAASSFNYTLTSADLASNSTGGLTKQGSGILVLSGASTYTGGTSVNAGMLSVSNTNGSATGTGVVTVGNTATLAGTGFISGSVQIQSGATLSPGNSVTNAAPGTLTLNGTTPDLTLAAGSQWAVFQNTTLTPNPAAANSGASGTAGTIMNLLSVTGTVTVADALNLRILLNGNAATFDPNQSYSFQVATTTSPLTPFSVTSPLQFDTTNFTNYTGQFTLDLTSSGTGVFLNLTAVPEPGTVAMIGAVLGTTGLWWYRRKQKTDRWGRRR